VAFDARRVRTPALRSSLLGELCASRLPGLEYSDRLLAHYRFDSVRREPTVKAVGSCCFRNPHNPLIRKDRVGRGPIVPLLRRPTAGVPWTDLVALQGVPVPHVPEYGRRERVPG